MDASSTTRNLLALGALAAVLVLVLVLVVRAREQQLRQRERLRADERLAERERIAGELHDTLLQSTQGLALKVHAVSTRMKPGESMPVLRAMLDDALADADLLMIEGRDRIHALRLREAKLQNIETQVRRLGQKLSDEHGVGFQVTVDGASRALAPVLAQEAHRIASEALLNAFRHARASRVEAELIFGSDDFRIRIRDDGVGIDPQVLQDGHAPGRRGLRGMRRRAAQVGGTLEVWSAPGAGTEIEFRCEAAVADAGVDASRRARWRERVLAALGSFVGQ
jgi:signal transduction histidine kinase